MTAQSNRSRQERSKSLEHRSDPDVVAALKEKIAAFGEMEGSPEEEPELHPQLVELLETERMSAEAEERIWGQSANTYWQTQCFGQEFNPNLFEEAHRTYLNLPPESIPQTVALIREVANARAEAGKPGAFSWSMGVQTSEAWIEGIDDDIGHFRDDQPNPTITLYGSDLKELADLVDEIRTHAPDGKQSVWEQIQPEQVPPIPSSLINAEPFAQDEQVFYYNPNPGRLQGEFPEVVLGQVAAGKGVAQAQNEIAAHIATLEEADAEETVDLDTAADTVIAKKEGDVTTDKEDVPVNSIGAMFDELAGLRDQLAAEEAEVGTVEKETTQEGTDKETVEGMPTPEESAVTDETVGSDVSTSEASDVGRVASEEELGAGEQAEQVKENPEITPEQLRDEVVLLMNAERLSNEASERGQGTSGEYPEYLWQQIGFGEVDLVEQDFRELFRGHLDVAPEDLPIFIGRLRNMLNDLVEAGNIHHITVQWLTGVVETSEEESNLGLYSRYHQQVPSVVFSYLMREDFIEVLHAMSHDPELAAILQRSIRGPNDFVYSPGKYYEREQDVVAEWEYQNEHERKLERQLLEFTEQMNSDQEAELLVAPALIPVLLGQSLVPSLEELERVDAVNIHSAETDDEYILHVVLGIDYRDNEGLKVSTLVDVAWDDLGDEYHVANILDFGSKVRAPRQRERMLTKGAETYQALEDRLKNIHAIIGEYIKDQLYKYGARMIVDIDVTIDEDPEGRPALYIDGKEGFSLAEF